MQPLAVGGEAIGTVLGTEYQIPRDGVRFDAKDHFAVRLAFVAHELRRLWPVAPGCIARVYRERKRTSGGLCRGALEEPESHLGAHVEAKRRGPHSGSI